MAPVTAVPRVVVKPSAWCREQRPPGGEPLRREEGVVVDTDAGLERVALALVLVLDILIVIVIVRAPVPTGA